MRKCISWLLAALISLSVLPLSALAEEAASGTFENIGMNYASAQTLLDRDDTASLARAKPLLESCGTYEDAMLSVRYIDARLALENGSFEEAAKEFQVLRQYDFRDAKDYYYYAQARQAEVSGDVDGAINLLSGLNVLDSVARSVNLRHQLSVAYGQAREPLPLNARENGLAMIIADRSAARNEPAGEQTLAEYPLYEVTQIKTFAHDLAGKPWDVLTIDADSPYALVPLGVSRDGFANAAEIYHFSEEEEQTYLSGQRFEEEPKPATYGTVTGQNVKVRLTPNGNRNDAPTEVMRGDFVTILGIEKANDGSEWYHIITPDHYEGYMPVNYIFVGTNAPLRAARKPVTSEDKATRFSRALALMVSTKLQDLIKARQLFRDLGNYENSAYYVLYLDMLIAIAEGRFDDAYAALDALAQSGYYGMVGYASSKTGVWEDYIRIPYPGELWWYIRACQAVAEGDMDAAIFSAMGTSMGIDILANYSNLGGILDAKKEKARDMFFDLGLDEELNDGARNCTNPECAGRAPHRGWECGHCEYTQTDTCMNVCPVCNARFCDGYLHERICRYCGAYDCTDTRGGAENHGVGKCVRARQQADTGGYATGNRGYTGETDENAQTSSSDGGSRHSVVVIKDPLPNSPPRVEPEHRPNPDSPPSTQPSVANPYYYWIYYDAIDRGGG